MGIRSNYISRRTFKESFGFEINSDFIELEVAFANLVNVANSPEDFQERGYEEFRKEDEPLIVGSYGTTLIGVRNGIELKIHFYPRNSSDIPAHIIRAGGNVEYFPFFSFVISDEAGNAVYGRKYNGEYRIYPGIDLFYVDGERFGEAVGDGYDSNQESFDRVSFEVLKDLVCRHNGFTEINLE